jgi:hypothetical protein
MNYYHEGQNKTISELKKSFKNVSFPNNAPEASWMASNNVLEVEAWATINPDTQKLNKTSGSIVSGKWRNYEVVDKTDYEMWEADMGKFRMTREIEEHYVNKHDGQTGDPYTQAILDAKVERRGQRPDAE